MEQIKISSKSLGAFAMPDFCPRCAWIKMKVEKLPWQIFPGIFSSIDSYTKQCVHRMIDHGPRPSWMSSMGNIVRYEKVPHWSKLRYLDDKNNILLTGAMDDILVRDDSSNVIPDYKTSKHTDAQDRLFPMYEAQVNGYALLYDQKADLFLVYFEPLSGDGLSTGQINDIGFKLGFSGHVVQVKNDKSIMDNLFCKAREIYEKIKAPECTPGCKDCESLDGVIKLLS